VQHPQQQLEQPRRGQRRHRLPSHGLPAELRHQPGQLRAGAAQHPLQLRGIEQVDERPQRLHHRRVRQDSVPDVQAAAAEGDRAEPAGLAKQFGHQPGLADARLARHHHDGGLAGCGPLQRRPELGDLGVTAGQHWTGDSSDHATDHPRCRIEGLTPQPGAAAGTAGAPTCGAVTVGPRRPGAQLADQALPGGLLVDLGASGR
jgi:hypothetical protein